MLVNILQYKIHPHVGSSQTRAQICVPCIGRWILNHCTTREVPVCFFNLSSHRPPILVNSLPLPLQCVASLSFSLFSPLDLLLDSYWISSFYSSHYIDFTFTISVLLSVLQCDFLRPIFQTTSSLSSRPDWLTCLLSS